MRYTPSAGTKVIIEGALYDDDGNLWYAVSNGEARLGGVDGPNSGYIPAGKVECTPPPGPVSETIWDPGLRLANEVVKAVRKIKFLPAEANGKPVDVTRTVSYTFSIY